MNPEPMMGGEEGMEGGGIDEIIMRVESYIQNPQMVTPETLNQLKSELIDLKGVLEGEPEEEMPMEKPSGGLSGMMKRGGEYA